MTAVERDSHIVIAVYSDQQMRDANEINVMCLKSRDGGADSEPQGSYFDPPYSLIASTSELSANNGVSSSDMDAIFSTDALDAFF